MYLAERRLCVAATWSFIALGAWALLQPLALADEHPLNAEEEGKPRRQIRVEVRAEGVPILGKLPYVERLFKNSGPNKVDQAEPCVAEEIVIQRGAIEDLLQSGIVCPIGNLGQVRVVCVKAIRAPSSADAAKCAPCREGDCVVCADDAPACFAVKARLGCANPESESCANSQAKACCADIAKACCAELVKACCAEQAKAYGAVERVAVQRAATCEELQCADFEVVEREQCHHESAEMKETIAELRLANATLEAKMQAKEEIYRARIEILEQWAKVVSEKSKLEAELAFARKMADERLEMSRHAVELKSENRELERLVRSLQEHKSQEVERQELATENQRLKERVAELERHMNASRAEVAR